MKTRTAMNAASGFLSALFVCAVPAFAQPATTYTADAEYGPDAAEYSGEDAPEAAPARGAIYARLRFFEGGISLRREDEAAAVQDGELAVNSPIIPGDQISTGEDGRIEVQLADGTLVRLDRDARLAFQNLADREASFDDTTLLRLLNGSLYIRADNFDPRSRRFQVDTPAGSIFLLSGGVFRIDVGPGGVSTVASYRGVAELLADDMSVMAHSGERVSAEPGSKPTEARAFNTLRRDPFDVWSEQRDDETAYADSARGQRPEVPEPVRPYVSELSRYGDWRHDPAYGWIWVPENQESEWRPYFYGQWYNAPIGMTWVSYEPWGWAPYHYGRWHWGVGAGWFWIPGFVYSGAYVSWAVGPSYFGWCPLGFYDYPIYAGHYYPWTYVPYTHVYYRHIYRHSYSWSDVARHRMNENAYVTRGHPYFRPGYRPESSGAATYRRIAADPRRTPVASINEAPKRSPFRDGDMSSYRKAIARRASPELKGAPGKSAQGKAGAGSFVRPATPRPGHLAPRAQSGRPAVSTRAGGSRVIPISTRPRGATGAGVSPVTGRPMQPPVRLTPGIPKTEPAPTDRPAPVVRRVYRHPEPQQRTPLVRGNQGGTVSQPARPGTSASPGVKSGTPGTRARVQPGAPARGSGVYVAPKNTPGSGAPKSTGARPAPKPRSAPAVKSGGGKAGGSGGKKGGKD